MNNLIKLTLLLIIATLTACSITPSMKEPVKSMSSASNSTTKNTDNNQDVIELTNRCGDLGRLGKFEEALQHCDKAIEINPSYAMAWNNRCVMLDKLGRKIEEALQSCDKAIAINPNYAEAWVNRGAALNHLKRNEEALQSCDKAIAINSNFAQTWDCRGSTLGVLGCYQEALKSIEQALAINPNNEDTKRNRNLAQKLLLQCQKEKNCKPCPYKP